MPKVALSYGHGEDTYRVKHSKGVTVGGVQYAEHTHNYEVGTRIRDILKQHGVDVLEVQPPNGKDVPLATRTSAANAWKADLYWSIHANAGASTARGWCAFYWGNSSEGKRAAQLYAKHVSALGLPLYSGDGIYPSEKGTWSDFHELRETNMVAILGENGFMTNSQDFEYIFKNKDNYYDRIAVAQAKAILEYFGIAYKEPVAPKPVTASTPVVEPVVSDFAKEAYKWVIEQGISDGSRPKDPVTREELWTMLYRYHN